MELERLPEVIEWLGAVDAQVREQVLKLVANVLCYEAIGSTFVAIEVYEQHPAWEPNRTWLGLR